MAFDPLRRRAAGPFPRPLPAALLSLVLGGCAAVGPDFSAPQAPAPADWASWRSGPETLRDPVSTAAPSSKWWEAFGDARLDALLARAREASPDLRTAALRFAQSRVQRQTAAAQRGPRVDASAGVSRQRQSEYGAGTRILDAIAPNNREQLVSVLSDPFTLHQAGFDASWELDLWGRVARSIEAADADVSASGALLEQARLAVSSEIARNYFELRGTQRQLRLLREDIDAAKAALELLQARRDGGQIDELDVSRQQALLADLNGRMPPLQAQEAAAANRIGLLIGQTPGALRDMLADTPDAALAALPDLALGLPSQVARRRPDIEAAEARLHAATAGIGIATADLYPRIVLGASFGYESFKDGKFGEWGSRRWSVGPSLALPLFDQGRRRTTVALRELEQQEAAVSYQQTVLRAWQEIDDALTGYSAERRRNLDLLDKLRASRDAHELAQARYAGGLTDFLTELDARRTLLQARRELAQSDSQLRIGLVAIYKAIGGGDEAAPSPAQVPGS